MEALMNGITKLRTVIGHAAHARYLFGISEVPVGTIPRQPEIPSPFAFSPEHTVWSRRVNGRMQFFFWVETKHRHYTFFEVAPDIVRWAA